MIAHTIRTLRTSTQDTELTQIARGRYKYPTSFNELKNALKWLLRKK